MKRHLSSFNFGKGWRKAFAPVFVAAGMIFFGQIAAAATITVTTTNYPGYPDCTVEDTETGLLVCSDGRVQSAVASALTGDTIVIGQGIYKENITFGTKMKLTLRSIDPDDENDTYRDTTILDGNHAGRVIYVTDAKRDPIASGSVNLRGLTIRNGLVAGTGAGVSVNAVYRPVLADIYKCVIKDNEVTGTGLGGGLNLSSGSPTSFYTLTKCIIKNNRSDYAGGGADLYGGSFNIEDCDIFDNFAVLTGGGINLRAMTGPNKISKTKVHHNSTDISGNGGGIALNTWEHVFDDCDIYSNTAHWASAIYYMMGTVVGPSNTYFVDTKIHGNTATNTGGISGGTVWGHIGAFINCEIFGNTNGGITSANPSLSTITLYNTYVTDQIQDGVVPGDSCSGPTYPLIINGCENLTAEEIVPYIASYYHETIQEGVLQSAMDMDFQLCPRPWLGDGIGIPDVGVIENQPVEGCQGL